MSPVWCECCGSVRASRRARGLYPLGALTAELKGEALAEIKTLSEAGCVAFMQTRSLPHDNSVLLQAMRYAKTFELPVWLRPVEDTLAGSGVAGAGAVAGRLGLAVRARRGRDGRAAHDFRVAARDRCADSYLPLVVQRGH